jgi:hypothetical protein
VTTAKPETRSTVVGTVLYFVDADGTPWNITERDCRDLPGARGARCLVFMSDSVFRRVWDYPVAWRALDDAGLTELSWRR